MGVKQGEIRYTEDHDWLRLESDGVVVVGITDYAQQQLGDLVFVQLPDVGAKLAANEEAAVVESVKAASDVKAPLAGAVVAVNSEIVEQPGTVNMDPLGAGWFMKMRLDHPEDLVNLMDEAAYIKHLESHG